MTILTPRKNEARRKESRARWTSGAAFVCYLALLRLGIYAFAGPNYGYFRDELYYLACAQRPAWGYVDQPPLIAWVAWLLQHTIGTSLYALRFLPALAQGASIVLAGLLARELGGRRWAMFLAGLGTLMYPVGLAFGHLFTMNAFDPVFWTAIAYCVVRIESRNEQRLWLAAGALTGVALLNKYGIAFWIAGLLLGIVCTPLRASLRQRWFWIACATATAIAWPNFLWQWSHHFPFLELMHNVRESGRDVSLSVVGFMKAQAEMIGYMSGVLVITALTFACTAAGRCARVIVIAFVSFFAMILALHGKGYYVAAVYPMVFGVGGVGLEVMTRRRNVYWIKPVLALLIFAVSAIYAPMIIPILSVDSFLSYERKMGIHQQKFENEPEGKLPQLYADMFGWEQMAQTVAAYYHTLPPEEQRKTAIFANNYGDGGAIDFFGPKYGLPQAIGNHQNYWIWGPRQYTGESMIVLGERREENMQTKCASYSVVGHTDHPLSRPDEWLPIYHCRGLRPPLPEMWPNNKHWN